MEQKEEGAQKEILWRNRWEKWFSISPTVEMTEAAKTTAAMPLIVARMTIVPPESLRFVKMKKKQAAIEKEGVSLSERGDRRAVK